MQGEPELRKISTTILITVNYYYEISLPGCEMLCWWLHGKYGVGVPECRSRSLYGKNGV